MCLPAGGSRDEQKGLQDLCIRSCVVGKSAPHDVCLQPWGAPALVPTTTWLNLWLVPYVHLVEGGMLCILSAAQPFGWQLLQQGGDGAACPLQQMRAGWQLQKLQTTSQRQTG